MLSAWPDPGSRPRLLPLALAAWLIVGCMAPNRLPASGPAIGSDVPALTSARISPTTPSRPVSGDPVATSTPYRAAATATTLSNAAGTDSAPPVAEAAAPEILPIAGAALPGLATPAFAPDSNATPAAATNQGAGPDRGQASSVQGAPYILPQPGSGYNPASTTIAVRYGDMLPRLDFAGFFHVSGTQTGAHDGQVVLSDDQKTLIFKPAQPFAAGETASVVVDAWPAAGSAASHQALAFSFSISPVNAPQSLSTAGQLVPQDSAPAQASPGSNAGAAHYATLPGDFPAITVTVPADGTGPGYIFATNFQLAPGPSGYYLLILDNSGEPVYYQKLAANSMGLDFKALPDGTLSYGDRARNAFVIMDHSYREIKALTPGNGYQALDFHDLQLLPNGHYLFMVNEARTIDLSGVTPGGNPQASVTGQVIQELDRDGNVVFQWRSLDYLSVGDTAESLTAPQIDFSHDNALEPDTDGNLLVSIRHLDQIIKIDRQTGAILWRLGGKANQFTFSTAPGINGPAEFYHQHDIRRLPNGHITLFDNHNDKDPKVSRALEYALDENSRTATLVWAWQATPAPYSSAMGNVQRLDNGNTLVNWGTNLVPNVDEVKPDGATAFELDFGGANVSYRAYRLPWRGNPTWPPALVAQATGDGLKLTFSWNGATDVAAYRVNGGNTPATDRLISDVPKAGFETSLVLPPGQDGDCYYQVTPVDAGGQAGPPSPVVANPACTPGR